MKEKIEKLIEEQEQIIKDLEDENDESCDAEADGRKAVVKQLKRIIRLY